MINNENYAHPARQDDREHSNFTVLVKSGAGVQVAERHGLLHVVVLLPPYKKVRDSDEVLVHRDARARLCGFFLVFKRRNIYNFVFLCIQL